MDNQKNLQQTYNKAFITGKLKEKSLEFKVSSTGKKMCMGFLVLVCATEFGISETKVKVLQMADKKDGTPNGLYKALETIHQTYQIGDMVRIEGRVEDGAYYSSNKGDFVNRIDLSAGIINRPTGEVKEGCNVAFEGVIVRANPLESGELEVDIIGFGYNGVAVPMNAIVEKENAGVFQSSYPVGTSSQFNIAVVNSVTKEVIQKEVGFGKPLGEAIEKVVIKRVLYGADNPNFDKFTADDVKQALAKRQAVLEQKKEDALKKSSGENLNTGFTGASNMGMSGVGFPNMGGIGNPTPNPTPNQFGGFPNMQ